MFDLYRIGKEAKGIGFGQVLDIDKKNRATIQVDAMTWRHIEKCRQVYGFGLDFHRVIVFDKLGTEIQRYRIEAKMNVRNPLNALFGVPIQFQWRMYEDKNSVCHSCCDSGTTIVIEDVTSAEVSHWYDNRPLPERDDELDPVPISREDDNISDSNDEPVSGEDSENDEPQSEDEPSDEKISKAIRKAMFTKLKRVK